MITLTESNYNKLDDLKYRLDSVLSWKKEHDSAYMFNKVEKFALANVVIEHFAEYISAYEARDVERIVESAIRHLAITRVAVEILSS